MLRILSYFIGLPAVLIGAFLFWNTDLSSLFHKYVGSSEIRTLEVRFTAEQIMEAQKKYLLKDTKHTYLESSLQFSPYALLEVKYSKKDNSTAEGLLLWSLSQGEAVLDTSNWEMTHGFEDCITAKADKNDFKLLKILSRQRRFSLDREDLQKELRLDNEMLDHLIESCRQKKLIVQKGNEYRLHFSNPRLTFIPETKIDQFLVTKSSKNISVIRKKYSLSEIEALAKAAFENDFTIRRISEVYLPIYSISVQNPDLTILTTHWNALSGKKINNLE